MILFLLLIAIAPGLFWLWYIIKRDKFEPEPRKMIRLAFTLGVISAFPSAIVEIILGFGEIMAAVIIAPVVEEFFKFLMVYLFIFRKKEFDEPIDGIIYASVVALGFATIENVAYVYDAYESNTHITIAVTRAIFTIPGHFLFSSFWGYALGVKKTNPPGINMTVASGLGLAMLMHGLFNFFAVTSQVLFILFLGLSVLLWIMFIKKIKKLHLVSQYNPDNQAYYQGDQTGNSGLSADNTIDGQRSENQ